MSVMPTLIHAAVEWVAAVYDSIPAVIEWAAGAVYDSFSAAIEWAASAVYDSVSAVVEWAAGAVSGA